MDMTPLMSLNLMKTWVAVSLLAASVLALLNGRRRSRSRFRLPPGPVPLPLVGNLFSIDAQRPWLTYAAWARRYGNIFMVRVLKQDIIVVNSRKIAKDLFESRSGIYSDRPYIAAKDPFGWSYNFGWAQYGDQWRAQRRMFHQAFRAEAALLYRPVQLKKARQLILNMISAPRDFHSQIYKFSAAVIMSVVYDYDVAPEHDHFVDLLERGNTLGKEDMTPEGSAIIEAFPFRKFLSLPEWFPGATLKRRAMLSKRLVTQMISEPFEYARKREAMGSSTSAMAINLLRTYKDDYDALHLQLLKDTCSTAFGAGAETTSSTLHWFMLIMLQHPEVQERAQAEIDAVVGTERLPNFDDRPNLPYIDAILMEILRMYAIAPLGLPHATTADDIYEDMFIPKGSVIVANIWGMLHNEEVYPEADVFKPERFLVDGKIDANADKSIDSLAFGFGRRVCPGRYAADNSVWIVMALVLWAFKITKALDEQGKEIEFEPSFTFGVTMAPEPFPCSITPRLPNVNIEKLPAVDPFEA